MTSTSDSSSWYTSTAQFGPLLLMRHLHPILTFKPLIPFPPTLYLLPLHPHHCLMILAVSLYLLLLLPLSTPLGLFDGMLGVSEPGALNCYTLFRLIPLTSFVSRNPKAVNRITHNLQLAITRFYYYLYCIHGTLQHIRNQYSEIGIITSNKRKTFVVPSRNPQNSRNTTACFAKPL